MWCTLPVVGEEVVVCVIYFTCGGGGGGGLCNVFYMWWGRGRWFV